MLAVGFAVPAISNHNSPQIGNRTGGDVLIDFVETHRKYLQGEMTPLGWSFEPIHPARNASAVYLSNYTAFSTNALLVAISVRNDFNEHGLAVKAHAGLIMVFSRKVDGAYLLSKDPERISITLDMGGVRSLYAWLAGREASFVYESLRPGAPRKLIEGTEGAVGSDLQLSAEDYLGQKVRGRISLFLSATDIFHIQMHCLGLAKLLYPSISDSALIEHLIPRPNHLVPPPTPAQNAAPLDGPTAEAGTYSIQERRRAVYAVGMNKWPKRNVETIEHIQQSSEAIMDSLIRAGNAGDFSGWDRLYSFMTSR